MTGRVLLLRALGLGDFLTGVPAYRAIRRAFPGQRIVLAAPAALADLVPLTGACHELLPTAELAPVPWPGPPPDVAIDLHGRGPASHRLLAALHPGRLITFGGAHGGGFRGPPWYPGEHEVARWCRLCTESGIPADPADLLLPAHLLPAVPTGPAAVLIHPGAAAASRRWPADRFAAVARELARQGERVLVTGSAAERALACRVAELAGLPGRWVLAGQTTLAQLAAHTAAARLVLAGDTGLAHLATAFGRPSVTLFGPVPPAEWGPPAHPRHQVLWIPPDGCRGDPQSYRGDPHGDRTDPALATITVQDVLAAADRALAAGQPGRAPRRPRRPAPRSAPELAGRRPAAP
jgi:ADP-heptose:LPS heptosyltransferase